MRALAYPTTPPFTVGFTPPSTPLSEAARLPIGGRAHLDVGLADRCRAVLHVLERVGQAALPWAWQPEASAEHWMNIQYPATPWRGPIPDLHS